MARRATLSASLQREAAEDVEATSSSMRKEMAEDDIVVIVVCLLKGVEMKMAIVMRSMRLLIERGGVGENTC